MKNIVEEIKERGLADNFSADIDLILGTPRTIYIGTDPTADSLHVGHLAWILFMKRLGLGGHKLIILVGGGTGMIGDPRESGERTMLDEKTLAVNTKALKKQLKGILGRTQFKMVDNADWLNKVKLVPFLRDIGKLFSVNDLIKRDLIKRRLETPDESISYTEFTYALLQGYDYLELNKKYDVDVQVGGSDQWTNILSGVDLIRRKEGKQVFAMGIPLVTDSNGKKFGKSEGNAIWLDAKKTSAFKFYQFWLNLPDEGLEKYFNVYTTLSLEDIAERMKLHRQSPGAREAQETLARVVTEAVHGPAAAAEASAASSALFGKTAFAELSREERACALAEAPSLTVSKKKAEEGYPLAEAMAESGVASSKSDARRLIEGKAVSINEFPITDPAQKLYPGDFRGGYALIKKGKRNVVILVLK
jgi:tyrosyl-tRNA synthetase